MPVLDDAYRHRARIVWVSQILHFEARRCQAARKTYALQGTQRKEHIRRSARGNRTLSRQWGVRVR